MMLPHTRFHHGLAILAIVLTAGTMGLAPRSTQAALLAGWDVWSDTSSPSYAADHLESGFTAVIAPVDWQRQRTNAFWGSNDGTFGTMAGVTGTVKGLLLIDVNSEGELDVILSNNTGTPYNIESFHFDFIARQYSTQTGFNGFTLTYTSGGLGPANTQIAAESDLAYTVTDNIGWVNNAPDYDYPLSPILSDITLNSGEQAIFRLSFSGGGTPTTLSSVLDNVAFFGSPVTVVPEPSALALLGLGGVMLLRHRRKKCR